MKTIALRFGEHFAPECGTIAAHQEIINHCGYVWYGKIGTPVSQKAIENILDNECPKILLIRSGKLERYWVYIEEIRGDVPADTDCIPAYYRSFAKNISTWFKVKRIELANKDVMSKCRVLSSGALLGEVSKHSMSPYYKIEINPHD